jgi:hypothetical protein
VRASEKTMRSGFVVERKVEERRGEDVRKGFKYA